MVPRHLWWQSLSLLLLSHLTWFPIVPTLPCLQAPIYCWWLVFSLLLCLLFLALSHPRVWLGLDPLLPLWLLLAPGWEDPIQTSSFPSYCASSFLHLAKLLLSPWFPCISSNPAVRPHLASYIHQLAVCNQMCSNTSGKVFHEVWWNTSVSGKVFSEVWLKHLSVSHASRPSPPLGGKILLSKFQRGRIPLQIRHEDAK